MRIPSWVEQLNLSLSSPEVEPDLCQVVFDGHNESYVQGAVADDQKIRHKEGSQLVAPAGNISSSEVWILSQELPAIVPHVGLGGASTDATKADDQASELGKKRKITSQQGTEIRRNTISTREGKRPTRGVSESQRVGSMGGASRPRDGKGLGPIKVTGAGIRKRSGRGNRGSDRVQGS